MERTRSQERQRLTSLQHPKRKREVLPVAAKSPSRKRTPASTSNTPQVARPPASTSTPSENIDANIANTLNLKFRVFDPVRSVNDTADMLAQAAENENAQREHTTSDATPDPAPSPSSSSSVPPSTTLPVSKDASTTPAKPSSAKRPSTPYKAPLERDFSGVAYTSVGSRSSLEAEYLRLLAERGWDWLEGRVVEVDLSAILAGMGLRDAFDLAREKVQGAGKADRERERIVKQFRKECGKDGSSGKNVANKWMGEMSECVGDRGEKLEWIDRHDTPLFKADSLVNALRRPDTVLVNKQLEGCAKLTWSSIFVFAEFTNAKVTLKNRNELHLKNLQAVLNGTTMFNVQSYRHYVLVLSFTKHDLFVLLLDRERVQAAKISGWKEGDGFLDSCALVYVLEHADFTHLGFPPYLTLDEKTNEPSSIDLGLLAKLSQHDSSTMKFNSETIIFPPPLSSKKSSTPSPTDHSPSPSPTNISLSDPSPSSPSASPSINSNSLPTIIPLSAVSPTRDSGPFKRTTWVGGDGKGLFVKISSPARDRAGHEPAVLTKLHQQVDPRYLGHQIPELVGAFLEDTASTSAWRVDEKLAEEYDDIIPRSTEILITRTPVGLIHLSELEPPPLLTALRNHLEIIKMLTEAGVSQRDVAPDNARATEDGQATLLDFDHGVFLCRDADGSGDKAVKAGWAGTMVTVAPDVLSAMARPLEDFYHRPHHDVVSLANLFWYSVSKRVLSDTWAFRQRSYWNTFPATPTSRSQSVAVDDAQKAEEAAEKVKHKKAFVASEVGEEEAVLEMFGWEEGNPSTAGKKRKALWSGVGFPMDLIKGLQNTMVKKALTRLMCDRALLRIVGIPTVPEPQEPREEFVKEWEDWEKEQKALETRFSDEALSAAIDGFDDILKRAIENSEEAGWDGVASVKKQE
ncbi:hypothetical protein MNV49_005744 [Pseudohyphozyma bogoriensis]|nr:hypothetical protein MNV49_005744 [Pseudohyphozyma bogoriensis]